jgi:DNA recombination protein RmuC
MVLSLIISSILCGILVFVLMRMRTSTKKDEDIQTVILLQQQTESIRNDLRESLRGVTDNLNQQLNTVVTQLQSQTQNVGARLDNAARVMGDVQRNLGDLSRATEEIKGLGESVSKLDNLLRAPKLRGGVGEFLLEDLLRQVLPAEHYSIQHRFRNGSAVDAVIKTSDRLTPVDSKFPLENFRKMTEAATDPERKTAQRTFLGDVKKHIDSIADKYILPDEGTFPFALMYIPAENIYYEVIMSQEGGSGEGLYSYAMRRRVIPVSPNSFYAYLLVITLGLRGMRIEERAREIQNTLGALHGDFAGIRTVFDTLGTHLENAHKKYEEADKSLSRFEGKLERIADASLLPEASAVQNVSLPQ